MQGFLLRWVFNTVAIYLTTRILPGLRVPDLGGALVAALVLGIVNAVIRPLLLLLTLPINILTLGLFTLVINAIMLYLVAAVTPLAIGNFWSAFIGALLIAIISTLLSRLLIA
ncbi:MAG: phage holin family protein [Armatimonadota bacterium]|nr:phage holin family protein [Armatimonadota bacterium]MDR7452203.1 phage holin family protein [Armatimonadota bacterium]MDR7468030.1 phage holin family protein [Armatimonadota bacterium]MDR7494929.1 phage holin family protein [Armatimonadota bacterium]MDR7500379.1 phage holin family protein [Armatimonadota bacterium]